jgi:hypothetical protein
MISLAKWKRLLATIHSDIVSFEWSAGSDSILIYWCKGKVFETEGAGKLLDENVSHTFFKANSR